jgi:hypothetical protein
MAPNVRAAIVPNTRSTPQAVIHGMIAYENPKPITFFKPMMRKMVSGAIE